MGKVSPFTGAMQKASVNLGKGYERAVRKHSMIPLGHEELDPRTAAKQRVEQQYVESWLALEGTSRPAEERPLQDVAKGMRMKNPPKAPAKASSAPPKMGKKFKNPMKREGGFVKDPTAFESGRGPEGNSSAVGYSGSSPLDTPGL